MSLGMVDVPAVGQIGVGTGGQVNKSLPVVADDFGGDILNDPLLDQSEDVFQIEAVLAPLECLLNAPALLLKLYEAVSHAWARELAHASETCRDCRHAYRT